MGNKYGVYKVYLLRMRRVVFFLVDLFVFLCVARSAVGVGATNMSNVQPPEAPQLPPKSQQPSRASLFDTAVSRVNATAALTHALVHGNAPQVAHWAPTLSGFTELAMQLVVRCWLPECQPAHVQVQSDNAAIAN